MGYRSDVLIAVAFENAEHRDAVWAIYCMDRRVGENNLAAEWRRYDDGKFPVLWYEAEDVKWYDIFDYVTGIEHILEVARAFAEEQGKEFAAINYRIGEETDDISGWEDGDGDMREFLWEMCGLERRIVHSFG